MVSTADKHTREDLSDAGATSLDWVDEASDESFPASDAPAWPASASLQAGPHLQMLVDVDRVAAYPLSATLRRLYGGDFGLPATCLIANFVSSVDGVVALGPEHERSGSAISGANRGDHLVMGLLRASTDVVLIGAGTLRATPDHRWTAEAIYPAATHEFRELRRLLGKAGHPRLAVVTARGDIDVNHPGLNDGGIVFTTDAGAEQLRRRIGAHVSLRSLGRGPNIDMHVVVDALRDEGCNAVLTEGGPRLVGQLIRDELLDELFLTISPALFGRSSATPREGLIEGVSFGAADAAKLDLRSVRHHLGYLFLRYSCH